MGCGGAPIGCRGGCGSCGCSGMRCNGLGHRLAFRRFELLRLVPRKFVVVVVRIVGPAAVDNRLERSSCAVRTEPQARRAVIDSCFLRLALWCPSNQYLNIRTESKIVSRLYVGGAGNSDCQILRGYKCILAANYQKTQERECCSGKTRSGE